MATMEPVGRTTRRAAGEENWRSIAGWPAYEVSDLGRVRRGTGGQGARVGNILKHEPPGVYEVVRLSAPGRRRIRINVDHLVADAFLGPCPEGFEVQHRNGDTLDNQACNLTLIPSSGLRHRAVRIAGKVRGERVNTAKLAADQVREIRTIYGAGGVSQKELGRRYGVSQAEIGYIVLRRVWTHV